MAVTTYGQTFPYKIYHYRNRNFGGKFSDDCYADSNFSNYAGNDARYIKMRLRVDAFTADACIFGASDASNYTFAIYITDDGYVEFRYGTTPSVVTFSDFELELGKIYNIWVKVWEDNDISCTIMDKYMNVLFTEKETIGAFSYPTINAFIAALNDNGTAADFFEGTIYDLAVVTTPTAGYNPAHSGIYRWVFHKNYESATDTEIACFSRSASNADLYDVPTDFWGSKTEITDYILLEGLSEVFTNTNYFKTRNFSTWSFMVPDGYLDYLEEDDTIAIEQAYNSTPDYRTIYTFRIVKVNTANMGLVKIDVEDVFAELQRAYVDKFFYTSSGNVNMTAWWLNNIPVIYGTGDFTTSTNSEVETYTNATSNTYAHKWISVYVIMRRFFYWLNLDYIADSFAAMYTSTAFNLNKDLRYTIMGYIESLYIGKSATSATVNENSNIFGYRLGDFFLKMCDMLAAVYGWGQAATTTVGFVGAYSATVDDVSVADAYNLLPVEDDEIQDNKQYHRVTANYGGSSYTWSAVDSDNVAESLKTLSFPQNMFVAQKKGDNSTLVGETFDVGGLTWGEQIASVLDTQLYGEKTIKRINTFYYGSNRLYTFVSKSDDIAKRTTKVKVMI